MKRAVLCAGPGGPTDALEVLLCAGADWRKRDCDGRTAVGGTAHTLFFQCWSVSSMIHIETHQFAKTGSGQAHGKS